MLKLRRFKRFFVLLVALTLLGAFSGLATVASAANYEVQRFESFNLPGYYIQHGNSKVSLDSNITTIDNSRFIERAGLADSTGVSYESINMPGYFLRHYSYQIVLQKYDYTTVFKEDATFKKVAGLADSASTSFQSYNFPDRYLRQSNFELRIDPITTDLDKQEATFKVRDSAVTEGVNYRIVSRMSGKLLEQSTKSTVVQMGLNKVTSEKWNFVAVSDGYYKIVNKSNGKLMDIATDGTIILADDSGSVSQNWRLVQTVGDYYKIVNRSSGKILDVSQSSTADGGKIIAYSDNNKSNQHWYIAPEMIGNVTYTLVKSANPTADELDAYEKIKTAMDSAVKYYNNFTTITRHLNVYYNPSVATADGSTNGTIRFGSGRGYMITATAMHEISHTVGVGLSGKWGSLMSNGLWNGYNANTELRAITGTSTDTLHGDRTHMWPYGLNQSSEVKSDADYINHCRIVNDMKVDGM